MSFGSVDPLWLVAGVVLHLCSQLARGRGWHSVVCASHTPAEHPRRRDVLATWIAGAGASGVLSARGGDALRILLLRRRMTTTCPRLVGTLAAETVCETDLGVLLTVWALSAGLIPGLHRPGPAVGALIAAGLVVLVLAARAAARRFPAIARACGDARRGLALLGGPGRYVRRVASWGVLSRALRLGSLACFLAAFALPVSLTAALVVMVAHSSGRLLPFGPAGAGASLGLLVAAFPAVTHTSVGAGELTAFYLGTTGLLTAVGIVLSGLVLVRSRSASAGARRVAAGARAPARAAQGARARARRLSSARGTPRPVARGPPLALQAARGLLRSRRRRWSRRVSAHACSRRSCSSAATRSGVRRPSASASATAQPGSPACLQSAKRQVAAIASTSANTLERPARLLPDPRQLEPGRVDHDAAARQRHELAPGRGVAAAVVGVADGAVARSPPARRLSSVVLPTPEAPSSTPVTPGPSSAATASSTGAVDGRDRQHGRAAAERRAHLGHARGAGRGRGRPWRGRRAPRRARRRPG